jgi:hypothetical protein
VVLEMRDVTTESAYRDLAEVHPLSPQFPQCHLFFTSPLLTSFLPVNISTAIMTNNEKHLKLPWTRVSIFRAGQEDLACSRVGIQE